ncbi:SurA N-terminal domain-containing protein [Aliikangiella sp. G2MR2-5]|uniref:SurA N-terminal domain-containing protein n=1 Tax=Aliikangiella sp. G2MR2-5 TaxID=2788943 RepID=UPI0018AB3F9F|nr:SurA N-terminal domain-containing protein [Aliikangiella sp. G2MR2-5]
MLESIREGVKKPWVKIVVFAIVISFVFAGYFTSSFFLGDPNAVAIVNGESISRVDFQREYQRVKAQQADYYNANVKTEEDEREFQERVLQDLINREVTQQATADLGMRLSDSALRKVIHEFPAFKDSEGNYSRSLVNQILVRNGMNDAELKSTFQFQETYTHLVDGITSTEFSLPEEARKDFELLMQKRSGKALKLNFEQFKSGIEVSEEEVQKYYNENQEAYRVEEKVSVDYIELSIDKLKAAQAPTDEEIESYYQDNITRFQGEDQKQFSHILILSNGDENAAKEKAEAIHAKLADGDFIAIGEAEADEAGDLGILLEGALEPAADEAAKALTEVGQVSVPVKIEDGYQILKLTNLIAGEVQSLEQVKDELIVELKKIKAEEDFYAKSELLKEKAFEFSDSLQEASNASGIQVETSPLFGLSSREGIFANQLIKDAAFSSDVKEALLNSQPIEIGENHLVILRLKEHKPSTIEPFEAVKERVSSTILQTKAKEKAGELANIILEKVKAKEEVEEMLTENSLSWTELDDIQRNNASLSYMTNQKFFKLTPPAEGESTIDMVEDFQGFAILVLTEVKPGDWSSAEEAVKKQRELFTNRYFANSEHSGFIETMRLKADVRRNLDALAQ